MARILFIASHRPDRAPGQRFRFEHAGDAIKALGERTALGKIVVEIE